MGKYNFDVEYDRTSTNSVKYDLRGMIFGRDDVIPLWVADMDFATPEFILEAIRRRLQHPILGYTFRGDGFTTALVEWIQKRHGYQLNPASVCFSPGIVPALVFSLLAYTEPGDRVIVQTPVYHPFFQVVESNGRTVVNNPLKFENNYYTIDFDDLERKAVGCKVLFFSNPHNPVGRCWQRAELERLADICFRHKLIVVSDEIHSDLMLFGNIHVPFASVSEYIKQSTISCYAPSKTFNLAGLSTSAVVIDNEMLRKKFNDVIERLHVGMGNIAGMVAFEAAYAEGKEWLDEMLIYVESNVEYMHDFLKKNLPAVKIIMPEATYMAWLDFTRTGLTNDALNKLLISEAGVGLNDGAMFGEGGDCFQRINLACPRSTLLKALECIKNALSKHNL